MVKEDEVSSQIDVPQEFHSAKAISTMNTLNSAITTQTIKLSFVDSELPKVQGKTLLQHCNNYFIGNNSKNWGVHCNNYSQVNYTDVWDNIDLSYFFTPEGMKYEYYVHPGADINDLQVQVRGAELFPEDKSLELFTSLGNLEDDKLLVFTQETKQIIEASFQVKDDIFSFALKDAFSCDETIVIDPIVYSTYLGGIRNEESWSIDVDNAGNAYITGNTDSSNFPVDKTVGGTPAPGYDQNHNEGNWDVFVVKLNPIGTEILYSTYLGGSEDDDAGYGIEVDDAGNVYMTGYTISDDFPVDKTVGGTPAPGYDKTLNGYCDVVVTKLNSTGTELLYSTYLGGSGNDYCYGISVDDAENAYITGYTQSSNFPMDQTVGGTPAPGYDQAYNGGLWDVFVTKINSTGTEIFYSTYLGGSGSDHCFGIDIDTAGNAYVSGDTNSSNFPMDKTLGGQPAPGYDKTINGDLDVFVTKLNSTGTELLYSTYLGGANDEESVSIDIDNTQNAYITGYTQSSNFPMDQTVGGSPAPGYDQKLNGSTDVFVTKLNSSGTEILYSTYLGGTDIDYGCAIAIDNAQNAYITGFTDSSNFPMTQTKEGTQALGYDKTINGGNDAFIVKLSISCPELYVEATSNKSSYFYSDSVFIDITLRNLGGLSTDSKLDIEIPKELSYVSCYDYRVVSNGQDLSIELGNIEKDEVITFTLKLEVTTDIHIQKNVPIIFDFTASECDSRDRRIVSIVLTPPCCPELYVEATPNKSRYFYRDDVLLNITLRNLGGLSTDSKLDIEIPKELSYVSCYDYRVVSNGQDLSIDIGVIEQDEVIKFEMLLEVTKDVLLKKSAPIIFELKANECDSYARRIVNILLEPQKASKQDFDLSVRLLNLEFDEATGKYYLPFDKTLEMLMKVCGCKNCYSCCIHWGDGECTSKEEKEPFIVKKHKFTAKGSMNIKVKVQDTNGIEKTSVMLVSVR